MLSRVLRSSTIKQPSTAALFCRGGGHGWPRPDVPMNKTEYAKRRWSMYENGMWLNCGTQPEFMLTNTEEWFTKFGWISQQAIGGIIGLLGICYAMSWIAHF